MKTRLLFVLLFIPVPSTFAQEKHPLVGTWELVYQKWTPVGGAEEVTDLAARRQLKIMTPGHWMFMMQSADGKAFVASGGGRYTLKGDSLYEHVDYFSAASEVGKTFGFAWRVEGDRWYHAGNLGEGQEAGRLEEVFRRVE